MSRVDAAARAAAILFRTLLSATLWLFLVSASGVALIVRGIFILAGGAWASIVAGAFLLVLAAIVRRGMING